MDYLEHKEVKDALNRAKKLRENPDFKVSGLVDEHGHQYVDLVQEGGGVLGIALVGYVAVLEAAGIRFYSLAGTSAGAINTMALAALGTPEAAKTKELLDILANQNLFDFVDGPRSVKWFIQAFINKPWYRWLPILAGMGPIGRQIKRRLGLNPGKKFEEWMDGVLRKHGIKTRADLDAHREKLPAGLKLRTGEPYSKTPGLVLITSDVTTKTKVKFPSMARYYWADPNAVAPSKFVRASMSIPLFFYPFKVDHVPADEEAQKRWKEGVKYFGPAPTTVRFVDGGMLSNFPINAFHVTNAKPTRPTFGARLSAFRSKESNTSSFGGFAGAMINTMRQSLDYDFLIKNQDYSKLICHIDANEKFEWLDFGMSHEKKVELFALGCTRAIEFLENWHKEGGWETYVSSR